MPGNNFEQLIVEGVLPPPFSVSSIGPEIDGKSWITDETLRNLQDNVPGLVQTNSEGTLTKKYIHYQKLGDFLVKVYDDWLLRKLPEQLRDISIDFPNGLKIYYDNVSIDNPHYYDGNRKIPVYPQMARDNMLTYAAVVRASPVIKMGDRTQRLDPTVIANIPLMLGSAKCNLFGMSPRELFEHGEDPDTSRGYFIVSGKELVIIMRERARLNKSLLYRWKKDEIVCRTTYENQKGTSIVEISTNKKKVIYFLLSSANPVETRKKKGLPRLQREDKKVNIFSIFRYLSWKIGTKDAQNTFSYDKIIRKYIFPYLKPEHRNRAMSILAISVHHMLLYEPKGYSVLNDHLIYRYFTDIFQTNDPDELESELDQVLLRDLFPNLNEFPIEFKLHSFGAKIAKIVEYVGGYRSLDDRDSWVNKRLESAGRIMEQLFRILWNRLLNTDAVGEFINNLIVSTQRTGYKDYYPSYLLKSYYDSGMFPDRNNIKQAFEDAKKIISYIKVEKVTDVFISSFTKTQWGIKNVYTKLNVVAILKRENKLAAIAHLLRIDIDGSHRETVQSVRAIQPSYFGFICVVHTPEGGPCGLVKNIGITTMISVGTSNSPINPNEVDTVGSPTEINKIIISSLTALRMTRNDDDENSSLVGSLWTVNLNEEGKEVNTDGQEPVVRFLERRDSDKVFNFNGKQLGWCDPDRAYNVARKMKYAGDAGYEMSVSRDRFGNINVYTDNSRLLRPVLTVTDDGRELVIDRLNLRGRPFSELLTRNAAVYIDPEEQNDLKITSLASNIKQFFSERDLAERRFRLAKLKLDSAIESGDSKQISFREIQYQAFKSTNDRMQKSKPYTHCQLHPQSLLGVSASIIPNPENNQSARSVFQSNMAGQALSVYHSNHLNRFDGKTKLLAFPSQPIFTTEMEEIIGLDTSPQGETVTIAFLSLLGMTGEDAFIISQRAVDTGRFRMMKYIPYTTTVSSKNHAHDELRLPTTFINDEERAKYHAIAEVGQTDEVSDRLVVRHLPMINAALKPGDIVIPKIRVSSEGQFQSREDNVSIAMGTLEEGIVDSVSVTRKTISELLVRVKLRHQRIPRAGDKFATRNAQKGTLSIILPTEDMPFTQSGTIPDMIANPHSIPGRMTMEYMKEIFTGKVAALTGERVNATPFEKFDLDRFYDLLMYLGYQRSGNERMYSGTTGEPMTSNVFIGPGYFQALRHHVTDKYQARGNSGGVKALTHQPFGGRSKGGGVRFGKLFCRCGMATYCKSAIWRATYPNCGKISRSL